MCVVDTQSVTASYVLKSRLSELIIFMFYGPFFQPKPIDVQVISHHMQRYAVWFGGSMLASTVRSTQILLTNTYHTTTIHYSNHPLLYSILALYVNIILIYPVFMHSEDGART